MRRAGSKEGFILAVAVWTVALAALGLSVAAIESRALAVRVANAAAETRDRIAAFSATQEALFTYAVSQRTYRGLEVMNRLDRDKPRLTAFVGGEPDVGDVVVALDATAYVRNGSTLRLQDSAGLAGLNGGPSGPKMRSVLEIMTGSRQDALALTDALNDWRDEDERRSLLGAEAPDYEDGLLKPANAPLRTVEELAFIEGWRGGARIDEAALADMFTVMEGGWPNLNSAPMPVLAGALEITETQARRLIEARPFDDFEPARRLVGPRFDPLIYRLTPGDGVRIDAIGPETRLRRRTHVELTPDSRDGPWRLDYVTETREPPGDDDVSKPVFPLPDDPAASF